MQALRNGAGGDYEPLLGFKHWRAANFFSLTDMTVGELKSAFDLPINATALGFYCNGGDPKEQQTCTPSSLDAQVCAFAVSS